MPKSKSTSVPRGTLKSSLSVVKTASLLSEKNVQPGGSASGSKGRKGKGKKPRRDPLPEHLWRTSELSPYAKIMTTDANAYYRLKTSDFKHLPYELYETDAKWECRLYSEIDIERVAWKKRGDPEFWDEYLEKLREASSKPPKRLAKFKDPRTRYLNYPVRPKQNNGIPPRLREVRDKFQEKDCLWLWALFIKALDDSNRQCMTYRAQESCLLAASDQLKYPARPENSLPLPASTKVNRLRSILAEATIKSEHPAQSTCEQHREWNGAYLGRVKEALRDALHGFILPDGSADHQMMAAACWEVYDKYVECIGGPTVSADVDGSAAENIKWRDEGREQFLPSVISQPSQASTTSHPSVKREML